MPEPSAWSVAAQEVEGLAIGMPGVVLDTFQASWPRLSRWIAALLLLFAGLGVGRISIRHNLYNVGSCLNIALFGIILGGCFMEANPLTTALTALLAVRMLRNFCCSFRSSYTFDALFRAALYLGIAILISGAAVALVPLLAVAIILFRRTRREAFVGVVGLLLPPVSLCYINWGMGGLFAAPADLLFRAAVTGTPLALLTTTSPVRLALAAAVTLFAIIALMMFLADRFSASTKSRMLFIFCGYTLLLSVAALALPAATLCDGAFVAATAALILPVMFVRLDHTLAALLYALFIVASVAGIIL